MLPPLDIGIQKGFQQSLTLSILPQLLVFSFESYPPPSPLPATFFFRVIGDSMTGANIHDGDLLVVDRSIEPKHGHIVLAVINNEYTVKRLYRLDGVMELHAENPAYPPLRFQEHDELQVWGVVTGAVSRFPV